MAYSLEKYNREARKHVAYLVFLSLEYVLVIASECH